MEYLSNMGGFITVTSVYVCVSVRGVVLGKNVGDAIAATSCSHDNVFACFTCLPAVVS